MKKIFKKTFKFRLKLIKDQRQSCAQYAGSVRYIFNFGLEQIKIALETRNTILPYTDLSKMLTRLKLRKPWLNEVPAQSLQQTLMDLCRSVYTHFKKKQKKNCKNTGFPKFKKKGRADSFRYPQYVRCENGQVFLPKIGWVRYVDSRPIEGVIKQATIKRQGEHWYVCITCDVEMDVPEIDVTEDTVMGIDVGLKNFVTTSDGMQIPNPSYLKRVLDRVIYLSKSLSRKKKGSTSWRKCRDRIRRLYIRISNMRADFLHKLSSALTKSHGVLMICVEDLNIKGMVQNRKLSRAISDAGWAILNQFLRYKCQWLGKVFVKVDRFYPSSKLCSTCGNKQDMPLNIRVFRCEACGFLVDRDINAAINLRSAGITELKACGEMRTGGLYEAGSCGF